MRNLANIGFEVLGLEDFQALASMALTRGKSQRAGRNQYYRHTDASGAELWVQVDENDEIAGMNAHFNGQSEVEVTLLRAQAYEERPLDGTFEAAPLHVDAGLAPDAAPPRFAFDLPDAHLVPSVSLPATARVQLVGFARNEVHCYASVEDYRAAHPGRPLERIQDVKTDRSADTKLSSLVQMDGVVVSAKQLQNSYTHRNFYWLQLKTAVGLVDVVASTRSLPELPTAGQVFDGQVRLSGRVTHLHGHGHQPGLVERFFWGAHSNKRLE